MLLPAKARYFGPTNSAANTNRLNPIPDTQKPMHSRMKAKNQIFGEKELINPKTIQQIYEGKSTVLRPNLSEIQPVMMAPIAPPMNTAPLQNKFMLALEHTKSNSVTIENLLSLVNSQ